MKSRLLLNILMLTVFSALIVIALFFTPDTNIEQPLTSLNPTAINTIFIPRKNGDISLQKNNGQWKMLSPYQIPAHDFRIHHLFKLTQLKSNKIYKADQLDLKKFGLSPPRTRIRFNQTWFDFGKTNPITQQRYIKSGHNIILANDDTYALINSQPSSFVNLSLLPKGISLQSIKLPHTTLQLKNTRWETTPKQDISADEIQIFLQNWKHAQAFAVHAYLKRKQLGHIIIQSKNKNINFEISDKSPWLILARPELGIEYHLSDNMLDKLLQLKSNKNTSKSSEAGTP